MIEFYYRVTPMDIKTKEILGTVRFYETKTLAMMFGKELQHYGYAYMMNSYICDVSSSKDTCKLNNDWLKDRNLYFEFRERGKVVKR